MEMIKNMEMFQLETPFNTQKIFQDASKPMTLEIFPNKVNGLIKIANKFWDETNTKCV